MADIYVDLTGSGSDTSPYDTWAKAATSLVTAITTHASAGDNIYCKTSATATDNKDTAAATRTITASSTLDSWILVWGCKNGTTNEPPVTADLVAKGDADVPIIEATGTNSEIIVNGVIQIYGIEFLCAETFRCSLSGAQCDIRLEQCHIEISITDAIGAAFVMGTSTTNSYRIYLKNCDITFNNAANMFIPGASSRFLWEGGSLLGTSPTYIFDDHIQCQARFIGVDLGGAAGTVADTINLHAGTDISFENCEINSGLSLASTRVRSQGRIRLFNCSSATAISTSVIAYEEWNHYGTISAETTRVRTGGADDGAAGDFSLAMLPHANTPQFPTGTLHTSLPTAIWLDGTETTVTVYIANDSASTDMQDDEVWLEVWASDSTLDTAQYVLDSDRMALLGTPANQTDDTGSTWGSGANNHQKLEVTIAPGYEGWALCYVHCAERAASPKTVYVDPLPVLS